MSWQGNLDLFYKWESGDDYLSAVAVTCCNEAEGYSNRYLVQSGSLYFGDKFFRYVLESVCYDGKQTVPTLADIAYALQGYCGIECDAFNGNVIVQVGSKPRDGSPDGLGSDLEPEYVLHGNANLEWFVRSNFLN
jgi:hypothetical protein